MNTIIREMTLEDIDEVYNMFADLYSHLNEKGFLFKLNLKTLKETLELQIGSNFMKLFVMETNKTLVGFINFALVKMNSKYVATDSKYIGNITELFIKKEYRGNHFGRILINEAKDYLKNNHVRYVQVNTMVRNVRAVNFYKELGFEEDFISFIEHI